MDYATLLGMGFVLGLVLWAAGSGTGGDVTAFLNLPGLLLVLGGSLAATVCSFALGRLRGIGGMLRKAFLEEPCDPREVIREIVRLADVARRSGLLAMEATLPRDDRRFLARAIRMIVDGYEPGTVQSVLMDEIEATDARHASARQFLDLLARYCPTFGMIGTLIGLVVMLRGLSDPARIGPGMAVALLTTLYGLVLANGVFVPLSRKLAARNDDEMLVKTIVLKGVLAIHAGDNPRVVEQKLQAFLPPQVVPGAAEPAGARGFEPRVVGAPG